MTFEGTSSTEAQCSDLDTSLQTIQTDVTLKFDVPRGCQLQGGDGDGNVTRVSCEDFLQGTYRCKGLTTAELNANDKFVINGGPAQANDPSDSDQYWPCWLGVGGP